MLKMIISKEISGKSLKSTLRTMTHRVTLFKGMILLIIYIKLKAGNLVRSFVKVNHINLLTLSSVIFKTILLKTIRTSTLNWKIKDA